MLLRKKWLKVRMMVDIARFRPESSCISHVDEAAMAEKRIPPLRCGMEMQKWGRGMEMQKSRFFACGEV